MSLRGLREKLPGLQDDEDGDSVEEDELERGIEGSIVDDPILERHRKIHNNKSEIEVKVKTESGEEYAGEYYRRLVRRRRDPEYRDDHLAVGINTANGFVETVPWTADTWFQHAAVYGQTGTGKSTLLKLLMVQIAESGYGFIFIDPKGDDSREILKLLPEHRLDDVIWIETNPEGRDKCVALNFLDLPDDASESQVESLMGDLESMAAGEQGDLGARMQGVLANFGRIAVKSPRNFTLLDLTQSLANEQYREQFAQAAKEDGFTSIVTDYTQQVAEMDDDDLEALQRRLRQWIENSITREIIGHNKSSVSISEAVEDGKIILVKNDISNDDVQRIMALGLIRRVWSTIQQRAGLPDSEKEPFWMFLDEFHDILSTEMGVDKMLAKARSMKLSLVLASQGPGQLTDEMQDEIERNTRKPFFFRAESRDDKRGMNQQINKESANYDVDVSELADYHLYTTVPLSDGTPSWPIKAYTIPPLPPKRDDDAVDELIEQSLEKYGADRLSDEELEKNLVFSEQKIRREEAMLKSISDLITRGEGRSFNGDMWVSVDALDERFNKRIDVKGGNSDRINDSEKSEIRQSSAHIETKNIKGEMHARLTDTGEDKVQESSGSHNTAGSDKHKDLEKTAVEYFNKIGAVARVDTQSGEELSDGVVDVPNDADDKRLKAIANGFDRLHVESETSTYKYPNKTLHNLKKAMEKNARGVFAVRPKVDGDDVQLDAIAAKIENFLETPYARKANGETKYYSGGGKNEIMFGEDEGEYAGGRPFTDSTSTWIKRDGEFHLCNRSEETITTFDSYDDLDDPDEHVVVGYEEPNDTGGYDYVVEDRRGDSVERHEYDDPQEATDDGWNKLKYPYVPEKQLPKDIEKDDYIILIFPFDDSLEPQVYRNGDRKPVSEYADDLLDDGVDEVDDDGGGRQRQDKDRDSDDVDDIGDDDSDSEAKTETETETETKRERQAQTEGVDDEIMNTSLFEDTVGVTVTDEEIPEDEGHEEDEDDGDGNDIMDKSLFD